MVADQKNNSNEEPDQPLGLDRSYAHLSAPENIPETAGVDACPPSLVATLHSAPARVSIDGGFFPESYTRTRIAVPDGYEVHYNSVNHHRIESKLKYPDWDHPGFTSTSNTSETNRETEDLDDGSLDASRSGHRVESDERSATSSTTAHLQEQSSDLGERRIKYDNAQNVHSTQAPALPSRLTSASPLDSISQIAQSLPQTALNSPALNKHSTTIGPVSSTRIPRSFSGRQQPQRLSQHQPASLKGGRRSSSTRAPRFGFIPIPQDILARRRRFSGTTGPILPTMPSQSASSSGASTATIPSAAQTLKAELLRSGETIPLPRSNEDELLATVNDPICKQILRCVQATGGVIEPQKIANMLNRQEEQSGAHQNGGLDGFVSLNGHGYSANANATDATHNTHASKDTQQISRSPVRHTQFTPEMVYSLYMRTRVATEILEEKLDTLKRRAAYPNGRNAISRSVQWDKEKDLRLANAVRNVGRDFWSRVAAELSREGLACRAEECKDRWGRI